MRGFPDSKCEDCGISNGGHLLLCAGRIPCEECGGKYRQHYVGCSKLWRTNTNEASILPDGASVKVNDLRNPFFGWTGTIDKRITVSQRGGTDDFYKVRLSIADFPFPIPVVIRRGELVEAPPIVADEAVPPDSLVFADGQQQPYGKATAAERDEFERLIDNLEVKSYGGTAPE